ncbi:MAG: glycosyltransferase family 9 protein [Methylocystis sp.]|uniref:tetratricopeptide repeat-containing glycosyltransferase family protein n=1 Tax=Methylocystis sp. TaxID=1911079 RepID=UPI003DA5C60A
MLTQVGASYGDAIKLLQMNKHEAALSALHIVLGGLHHNPDPRAIATRADAWSTAGTIYDAMGKKDQAKTAYRLAIGLNPRCPEALHNLGAAACGMHDGEAAVQWFTAAAEAKGDIEHSKSGLVGAFVELANFRKAIEIADEALAIDPTHTSTHWNLTLALLGAGQWDRGLKEHEWRKRLSGFMELRPYNPVTPEWNGGSLEGVRLLVLAEQGFGDMVMWARFLPALAEMGAEIVLECHKPLMNIFRWMPCISELTEFGKPLPPHDQHIFIGSLALHLGVTSESIAGKPYLTVPPVEILPAGKEPRVAIAWQGRADHGNDHNRSLTPDAVQALVNIPGIRWVSLQFDATPPVSSILDCRDRIKDNVGATAAIMAGCDLVISVDSGLAHLAGAMGLPVWLLGPNPPEWRWCLGRPYDQKTPWYDSMTMFRQAKPGDWRGVFAEIHKTLNEMKATL